MPVREFQSRVPGTTEDLFAWHARPGAFERLCPPWQEVSIERPAPLENGSRVLLRMKKGPLTVRWTAEHSDVDPGTSFTDTQVRGPFARWIHRHSFEKRDGGSRLVDRIDYALPGGALGRWIAGPSVDRDVDATFAYRHDTTRRDLERHRRFAGAPQRIAVSGSSGLVGRSLVPFLTTGGHEVVRLVRRAPTAGDELRWSPESGLAPGGEAADLDAVVHLAGAPIAQGRWTTRRKREIRASRVEGTRRLVSAMAALDRPPRTLVCASAVGFYGSRGEAALDETSEGGRGFLADVCREWEAAADEAEAHGIRVVKLRFGVVLSPAGGALARMLPAFRACAGGRLGDGRQLLSWVSRDDAVGAVHHALMDDRLRGPVNVTAPRPVPHHELTETLGRVLRRPTLLPLPAGLARRLFGEMADELLLSSTRALPRVLERSGFEFHDTDLEATLTRLLGRSRFPRADD